MNLLIFTTVFYALGLPIIMRLLCVAHTQVFIKRKQANAPRNRQALKDLPKPIWPPLKERLSFTLKDKRAFTLKKKSQGGRLTNRQVFWLFWLAGLGSAVTAGLAHDLRYLGLAAIIFFFTIAFGVSKANPIIKTRQQVYQKMFEVGRSSLGLSAEYADNPLAVIQVQEWRDLIKPTKVRYEVPTSFGADSEESFLRQFNQIFGTETTWVPYTDPDTGKPGWNYEEGYLTLKETPPLPQMAPWSEHYVLDPAVAWSFFPLALGVEHGIELLNPKTGEIENVLGFDVAGEQAELSKKMGMYCSPTITTSPMALVAGGTGGGKALDVDTPVRVIKKKQQDKK